MSNFDVYNKTGQYPDSVELPDSETAPFPFEGAEKYKAFFYNAPLSIVSFNNAGYITDFNENFVKMLGMDTISILTFNLFSIQDKAVVSAIKSTLQGHEAHFEGLYKSLLTGKTFPVKAEFAPILSGDKILGGMVYIEDISFKKQLERFFFHDVLNACGNIRNLSEILTDVKIDALLEEKLLKQISAQSNRLLDDLSVYRHLLSSGKTDLKPEYKPINSIEFLQKGISRFDGSDLLDSQIFEINEKSDDFIFNSSTLLTNKILDILIKYAISVTGEDEIITLSSVKNDTVCRFSVHNPSVIPEEIREKLFTPEFYKNNGEKGLGTYCMKYLAVNYLDGDVAFNSSEELGTEFILSLPA